MPATCSAYKCFNNSDEGYSLFRYPHDETLKQKWIAAVGRGNTYLYSSSERLCEVHFLPSEIEFVAGRKRIKVDSVPSRFCTCTSSENQKSLRNVTENNSSDQMPLTELNINNLSNGKKCRKRKILFEHNCNCVQTYKPLKKIDIEKLQEHIHKMQTLDKNENLNSLIDENEQLRNEVKRKVEEIVKLKNNIADRKKTAKIDSHMYNNDVLNDKQKVLIEEIRRENDMLRTVVSLFQNILQNERVIFWRYNLFICVSPIFCIGVEIHKIDSFYSSQSGQNWSRDQVGASLY